jgi:hypothetical protein
MSSKFRKIDFKMLGSCMVCQAAFREADAEIFKQDNQNIIFHIDCQKCHSSSIVVINNFFSPNFTIFGILTDLTKKDLENIENLQEITSDDVLAYHTYISNKSNKINK